LSYLKGTNYTKNYAQFRRIGGVSDCE